ncbi:MAG: YceD family protein [Gammaproteobacteria bacterium]|nr:YceD family protein [Gammaproteobacteria bacterium]MDH3576399.1 YceD family protein [Gammaproteobacteria bacterium]
MANPLRDRRTAAEWAAAGQVIDFAEKLSFFGRLASIVEEDLAALEPAKMPASWRDSVVTGKLEFGFADPQRRVPTVVCKVAVTVDAVCQRCLEAFRLPLETGAELLLLALEDTAEGYEDHEVWELEESTLRPQDIVEEMLIMALPFSAMHVELESCRALSTPADEQEDRTKPFAALRAQMTQD